MAIIYSLLTAGGNVTLGVSQVTTYALLLEGNLVDTGVLQTGSSTNINTSVDGTYTLNLQAEEDPNLPEDSFTAAETFVILKNLEYSLSRDMLSLVKTICSLDTCGIASFKNIVNKFLTYHLVCLPKLSQAHFSEFNVYLSKSLEDKNSKIITSINSIVYEDRIQPNETDIKLTTTFLIRFWAGFYFNAKNKISTTNLEELQYVKEKFCVSQIVKAMNCLCVTLEELEILFNSTSTIDPTSKVVHSFQLDQLSDGMNEVLTNSELVTAQINESILIAGHNISYNKIAKVGFIVRDNVENPYVITNFFGVDITNSYFDYLYQDNVSYYLSKNYVSFSTIYYKFQVS